MGRFSVSGGIEPASEIGKNRLNVAKGLEFLLTRRGNIGEEDVEKKGKWVPAQRSVGVCGVE